jgi:plastocyanin
LSSASGTTLAYSPSTPVTAKAGVPIRLTVTNASTIDHRIGARTSPGNVVQTDSAVATPANSVSAPDVTLPAGSYQIFCGQPGHAAGGMVVTLTVTP